MLFRPGPFASALSGSVQGLTFANSAKCPYARSRQRSRKSASSAQLAHRTALGIAQKAWIQFTDATKDAWRTAASTIRISDRLGVERAPTAQNLFATIVCFDYPHCIHWDDLQSNYALSATATADTERVGWEAAKINDGITGSTNAWMAALTYTTGQIDLELADERQLQTLRWMDRPLTSNTGPNAWTFKVHDGTEWITLRDIPGSSYLNSQWHTAVLANDVYSKYYRWDITENQGDADELAVSEIMLSENLSTMPNSLAWSPAPEVTDLCITTGGNWSITIARTSGYKFPLLSIAVSRVMKNHAISNYNTWQRVYLKMLNLDTTNFITSSSIPNFLESVAPGEVLAFRVRQRFITPTDTFLPSKPTILTATAT